VPFVGVTRISRSFTPDSPSYNIPQSLITVHSLVLLSIKVEVSQSPLANRVCFLLRRFNDRKVSEEAIDEGNDDGGEVSSS
jgi:hypothetical protein